MVLPSLQADLDGGVLGGRDHDAEHGVEDDAGDRAAVAAQGVFLGRAWDPLFGVPLLSDGPTQGDLLLRLVQLRLQLHDLSTSGGNDSNGHCRDFKNDMTDLRGAICC